MRLSVEHLSVRFGRIVALRDVSLGVAPGERLGLVGPNGAGKTALLDAIGGLARPTRGEIRFGPWRLSDLPPDAVARAGVGRTFQVPRLCTRLTVAANVRAGRALDPEPWLERVGLAARRHDLAGALTAAEARRLELARALAAEPRLLALDEPFGGLTPAETDAMAALVARVATPDRVTLVVEHKLGAVTRLCDRVIVLSQGEAIFDGPSAALRGDARVREAYLGRSRAG